MIPQYELDEWKTAGSRPCDALRDWTIILAVRFVPALAVALWWLL